MGILLFHVSDHLFAEGDRLSIVGQLNLTKPFGPVAVLTYGIEVRWHDAQNIESLDRGSPFKIDHLLKSLGGNTIAPCLPAGAVTNSGAGIRALHPQHHT